jgi:hypothetical protein
VCDEIMGRNKEFKVQKAFTIGAKEIMWAQEKAHGQKLKLSTFIHDLIHKAMVKDLKEVPRKPSGYCYECEKYVGYDFIKDKYPPVYLCENCQHDNTEVIKYGLQHQ